MSGLTEKNHSDLEWLRRAADSKAFGPCTKDLLMPYVKEIEHLRALVDEHDERRLRSE